MPEPDDPLWLHSPGKRLAFRIACYLGFMLIGALGLGLILRSWGAALAGALAVLFGIVNARGWIHDWMDARISGFRAWTWRHREGRHYAFAGIPLSIHDDGRDSWIAEDSVRRLLGLHKDPALKARFASQWREAAELGLKGRGLWIKVQALHQHLADAPERLDPKRVRLRSYLDREILQPAARRRAGQGR